jgi:hypothetical protein
MLRSDGLRSLINDKPKTDQPLDNPPTVLLLPPNAAQCPMLLPWRCRYTRRFRTNLVASCRKPSNKAAAACGGCLGQPRDCLGTA